MIMRIMIIPGIGQMDTGTDGRNATMDKSTRNSLIAAALILGGFGLVAFLMPRIMLSVGEVSTVAAGFIAFAFVAAFFLVFYLRGKSRGG